MKGLEAFDFSVVVPVPTVSWLTMTESPSLKPLRICTFTPSERPILTGRGAALPSMLTHTWLPVSLGRWPFFFPPNPLLPKPPPYKVSSSSAFSPFGGGSQQQNPTSSGNVPVLSSPSHQNPASSPSGQTTATSSSAAPVDPNAWGTCAANTTTNSIKKGASVQWKLALDNTKVDAAIMTSGSYSWTFQDGSPDKATVQKSLTSPSITYATSGEKTASVVVSYQGKTNTIQCTPLDVTGAEVTGCSCIPSESQIDIATQPRVTWSVTKCSSTETTFSYEWSDGLVGTNSATGDLNTKGTFAPTVKVKTDIGY